MSTTENDPLLINKKVVLSINAANGSFDWELVSTLATDSYWDLQEVFLDDFGPSNDVRDDSFIAALEKSSQTLSQALECIFNLIF